MDYNGNGPVGRDGPAGRKPRHGKRQRRGKGEFYERLQAKSNGYKRCHITEKLAENVHENWAKARMEQGWTYGPVRDEASRTTPCLVPYGDLTEEEKEYDRRTALETVRQIVKLGYNIQPKEGT